MILSFILLLSLFSTIKTTFTCASPIAFDGNNTELKKSLPIVLKLQNANGDFLHQVMFDHSKSIFIGGFGEVREYNKGGKIYVIKKIVPKTKRQISMMEKEIEFLKVICGLDPKVVNNTLEPCKSNAIAGFNGCVEDGLILYIFQEKMKSDIQNEDIIKKYSNLRGRQKADIMLQIISKFQKIHDKKIVHADIKPNNLMTKDDDFDDIRIIDFGMSGYVKEDCRGGTPYFIAPEHTKKGSKLSVQADIYSLAVTFAMMEYSSYIFLNTKFDKICIDPKKIPSDACVSKFRKGIIASFNRANETSLLSKTMIKALEVDPTKRIQSMTDFKIKILEVYDSLPTLNSPRVQNSTGFLGCIKRILKIGNRVRRRVLSSSSNNEFSTVFSNRILAEEEAFGLEDGHLDRSFDLL